LTKRALRGDIASAQKVLDFLWSRRRVKHAAYTAYALVYQIAMNVDPALGELCRVCGGACCSRGPPIPVYDFDIEELAAHVPEALTRIENLGQYRVIRRPCPFQEGWRCTIHEHKPYACLCYPFMTEEIAIRGIERYRGRGVPDIETDPECRAALAIKEVVDGVVQELRAELDRDPSPMELLMRIAQRYGLR